MSDVNADLKTLLDEKADEMRLDRRIPRGVLRRARRRRAGTAALAGALTVGLALGAVIGTKALLEDVPSPTGSEEVAVGGGPPRPAIWPAPEVIEATQEQVAEGHMPWWVNPELVARSYAAEAWGWLGTDVEVDVRGDDPVMVVVANPALSEIPTRLTMALAEGDPGIQDDIYVVTAAETDALTIREPLPGQPFVPGSRVFVRGTVQLDPEEVQVEASLTWGGQFGGGAAGGGPAPGVADFEIPIRVPAYVETGPVLAVNVRDPSGATLGQTSFRLGDPEGSVTVTAASAAPPEQALPEPVAATRDAILAAAEAGGWEALRALIPEKGFTFTFGGETDPIAYWRQLEEEGFTVLPTLETLLEGPAAPFRGGYIWPAPATEPPEEWTDEDLEVLRRIHSDREIDTFFEFGNYIGWRVGIDGDGTWIYYVAGD